MNLERWAQLAGALVTVVLVRGSAVFAAACAVTSLARRLASEARHRVWLGVIASFLLIPLAWALLPPIRIGTWLQLESAAGYGLAAAPFLARSDYLRFAESAREYALLTRQSQTAYLRPVFLSLAAVWCGGVLALLTRLALARRKLRRLVAAAHGDGWLQALAGELAADLSIRHRPAVRLSAECRIPFTCRLGRPVILLPAQAAGWPIGRQRSILIHELAHVRRRDVLLQSVGYAICLLFWFIPPVWWAYGALLREAETCCDRLVLQRGFRGPEYAHSILELARGSGGRILLPCVSAAAGRTSALQQRIKRVLRLGPERPVLRARAAAWLLAAGLCCLLPLLAVTCATKPARVRSDDPVFGTWVNPAYDGTAERPGKWVLFTDGRELDFVDAADDVPFFEGRNLIQEAWLDRGGNRWYRVLSTGDSYPYQKALVRVYALQRVDASGRIFETVISLSGYPPEITPSPGRDCTYGIWFKPE